MNTIAIKQAQATLIELIHSLPPGAELVITENDKPVAKIMSTPPTETPKFASQFGTLRGTVWK